MPRLFGPLCDTKRVLPLSARARKPPLDRRIGTVLRFCCRWLRYGLTNEISEQCRNVRRRRAVFFVLVWMCGDVCGRGSSCVWMRSDYCGSLRVVCYRWILSIIRVFLVILYNSVCLFSIFPCCIIEISVFVRCWLLRFKFDMKYEFVCINVLFILQRNKCLIIPCRKLHVFRFQCVNIIWK